MLGLKEGLKTGNYGIVYPDGNDKLYEYVFYNKGWCDEKDVMIYGVGLVITFTGAIISYIKDSKYPFVSKKEILERAIKYKKYQERMWGGVR